MFFFALKNMAVKKIQILLVVLSIVLSASVGVLAYNIGEQINDGITSSATYYSAIIGPSGSSTQLVMNTVYFTDAPLGTIPYSVVTDLQKDSRVKSAIPFAMADSYNGYSCVGTTSEYLSEKTVGDGKMFDDAGSGEVVVGYRVAKLCGLSVGDSIHTNHSEGEEHHEALVVVGILNESHTSFDNIVFTQLKTLWDMHEHEEAEEASDEHEHMTNAVCAILIKTTNPGTAMAVVNDYNGKVITADDGDAVSLQAIEPMNAIRGVLSDTDNTKFIVYILCAIILAMNIAIISIITLLNMYHSAKEIALMRLIGISMKKINLLYIIQNSITGLLSTILAFGVSRLCLYFAGDKVAEMGVVLNLAKVYPAEIAILVAIIIIAVLPTVICTAVMSKRDGTAE